MDPASPRAPPGPATPTTRRPGPPHDRRIDYQRGVDVLIVDTDPETTPQAEKVPGATFVRSRAAIPALVREAYQTRYGCPLPV